MGSDENGIPGQPKFRTTKVPMSAEKTRSQFFSALRWIFPIKTPPPQIYTTALKGGLLLVLSFLTERPRPNLPSATISALCSYLAHCL